MRRSTTAIAATVAGLGLLTQFHSSRGGATALATTGAAPSTTSTGSRGAVSATSPAPTTTTAPSSTTTGSTRTTRTIDGAAISTRYGTVQVRVTISSGRITDISALQLPSDRARSASISSQAGPMLRREALQAQSAQIDIISGATYTSEGYASSLQAALRQAGL